MAILSNLQMLFEFNLQILDRLYLYLCKKIAAEQKREMLYHGKGSTLDVFNLRNKEKYAFHIEPNTLNQFI